MTARSHHNGSLPVASATNGDTSHQLNSTSRFHDQGDSTPEHDELSNGAGGDRPTSAPGRKNSSHLGDTTRDDMQHERPKRPVKPLLQRSKSDYAQAHRPADDSDTEDEIREWGARHGFEDHYQSEHIISQLASVSFGTIA